MGQDNKHEHHVPKPTGWESFAAQENNVDTQLLNNPHAQRDGSGVVCGIFEFEEMEATRLVNLCSVPRPVGTTNLAVRP